MCNLQTFILQLCSLQKLRRQIIFQQMGVLQTLSLKHKIGTIENIISLTGVFIIIEKYGKLEIDIEILAALGLYIRV